METLHLYPSKPPLFFHRTPKDLPPSPTTQRSPIPVNNHKERREGTGIWDVPCGPQAPSPKGLRKSLPFSPSLPHCDNPAQQATSLKPYCIPPTHHTSTRAHHSPYQFIPLYKHHAPRSPSNVRRRTIVPSILINKMSAHNLPENHTTVVEQSEICHFWRTHHRNTSEVRKSRGPQHALGNIGVAGRTRGYKSLPNGPTCQTPQFPYALAPRAPLAPRLHPIPYTRITICNGISNHTTSSIYVGPTTVNKKVYYEILQQSVPYPRR